MRHSNGRTESALVAGMARIARWIALALVVAITAVTLCPISLRPVAAAPADVERAFAFAVLGMAIALAWPRHRDLIVGALFAVAFAALLEAGQNFAVGRHGQMHDFLIKALAAIFGMVAVWIVRRRHRPTNY